MTPQKPPLSFFQKHKKYLLSVLLSGTILATGSGGLFNKDALANVDFDEGAQSKNISYPDRGEAYFKQASEKCTQTGYAADQVPKGAEYLWKNMQFFKGSQTLVATPLAEFSDRAGVFYCYKPEMSPSYAGLFLKDSGLVYVNPSQEKAEHWHIQAHETIHAIQRANGVLYEAKPTWSMADLQSSSLFAEAAAMTGEFLVALELSQKGNKKENEELYKDTLERNAQYVDVYKEELKKGSSHAEALSFAGQARFWGQLSEQYWLDFYNNLTLKEYMNDALFGKLKAPSGEGYTLGKARMVGYISPEFNFTAKLDHLPTAKERFGSNMRMQQAFDYVEVLRLAKTLGKKSPVYQQEMARLKKEKNPYLGINMNKAWSGSIPLGDEIVRSPLESMDYQVSLLSKKAPAPKKTNTI